jgi:hypothetical protein
MRCRPGGLALLIATAVIVCAAPAARAAGTPAQAVNGFMTAMAVEDWRSACRLMTSHTDDRLIADINDFSAGHRGVRTCPEALRKSWRVVLNASQRIVLHADYLHARAVHTRTLSAKAAVVTFHVSGPLLPGARRDETVAVIVEDGIWKLAEQPAA